MARSFVAGSSQSIAFPSATATNVGSGDFTVLAWVRFPVVPANNSMIVGKRAGGFDGDEGWELKIENGSNGGVRFDAQTNTSGRQRAEADLAGLTNGNWHLVGGDHTENPPAGLRLWYDGVIANTNSATTIGSHNTATPLVLAAAFNTPNTNYLTGHLGWVAIWKRILTQSEHTALAKGFSPRFFRPLPSFLAELTSRASPEKDIRAGLSGTLQNAPTVVSNPHRIYPRSPEASQDLWYELANATIDGQSTLVVTQTRGRTVASTSSGQSAVAATITRGRTAAVTVAGQSAFAASLSELVPVDAIVAAQSSLTANINPEAPLRANIAAQSTVTATANINAGVGTVPIEGQSSISASLSANVPVDATVGGQSAVVARMSATAPVNGTIAGQSALTVTGDRIRTASTTLAGQSALSGSVTVTAGLDAQVAAQSSLAGSLSATVPVTAIAAGISDIVADASALTPVSTAIAGQGALTAASTKAQAASATIAAQSSLVVDTRAFAPLETTIAAQSALIAAPVAIVSASTAIAGQSDILARPTYPGVPKTTRVGGIARWLLTVGGRIRA